MICLEHEITDTPDGGGDPGVRRADDRLERPHDPVDRAGDGEPERDGGVERDEQPDHAGGVPQRHLFAGQHQRGAVCVQLDECGSGDVQRDGDGDRQRGRDGDEPCGGSKGDQQRGADGERECESGDGDGAGDDHADGGCSGQRRQHREGGVLPRHDVAGECDAGAVQLYVEQRSQWDVHGDGQGGG